MCFFRVKDAIVKSKVSKGDTTTLAVTVTEMVDITKLNSSWYGYL